MGHDAHTVRFLPRQQTEPVRRLFARDQEIPGADVIGVEPGDPDLVGSLFRVLHRLVETASRLGATGRPGERLGPPAQDADRRVHRLRAGQIHERLDLLRGRPVPVRSLRKPQHGKAPVVPAAALAPPPTAPFRPGAVHDLHQEFRLRPGAPLRILVSQEVGTLLREFRPDPVAPDLADPLRLSPPLRYRRPGGLPGGIGALGLHHRDLGAADVAVRVPVPLFLLPGDAGAHVPGEDGGRAPVGRVLPVQRQGDPLEPGRQLLQHHEMRQFGIFLAHEQRPGAQIGVSVGAKRRFPVVGAEVEQVVEAPLGDGKAAVGHGFGRVLRQRALLAENDAGMGIEHEKAPRLLEAERRNQHRERMGAGPVGFRRLPERAIHGVGAQRGCAVERAVPGTGFVAFVLPGKQPVQPLQAVRRHGEPLRRAAAGPARRRRPARPPAGAGMIRRRSIRKRDRRR